MSNHHRLITLPTKINIKKIMAHDELRWLAEDSDTRHWYNKLIDLNRCEPRFYKSMEWLFREEITSTRLFVAQPQTSARIHVDIGYNWALNIPLLNGDHSISIWWKMKDTAVMKKGIKRDAEGTSFAASHLAAGVYDVVDAESTLEFACLNQPSVVDTGTPHNIITDTHQPGLRVMLSIRFGSAKRETFSEAVERLAQMKIVKK